jgi:hypothetical protein
MAKPAITKRSVKTAALTYAELDTNFQNLADATVSITAGSGGTQVTSDLNGNITLVAGTGVTITGNNTSKQITISSSAAQNIFNTIAVAGQSNIVADSATDTLTVVAGSNIVLTTDAATDTLTISSSAASSQNVFSTIAVAGQSDVVADSTSDTLTLAAGNRISLTTNATTDTVTITANDQLSAAETNLVLRTTNAAGQTRAFITIAGDGKNINISSSIQGYYLLFSGSTLNGSGGVTRHFPISTTDRDGLNPILDGMIIYNSTVGKFQGRAAGAWVDLH